MPIGAPRNDRVRRIFTIVLTIIFLSQNIAWTAPSQAPLSISYQPSANLYIPEQYGRIDKSVNCKPPTVNSKSPQVILIKDAHCNYEAQKNIENILDILIREYGIDLVCVEGAVSKVDTSRLGSYNNQKARQKVADKYTENGLFTASEALGVKKGLNPGFDIYGVEDAKLYWKDFQAFRDTVGVSETNNRFLQLMCDLISGLKGRLYTKKLKEFDNEVKRYRNNEIPLTEWIKYLRNQKPDPRLGHPYQTGCSKTSLRGRRGAADEALDSVASLTISDEIASLPSVARNDRLGFSDSLQSMGQVSRRNQKNLRLVIQSIELEEGIDFKKVETERAALIKELEKNLVKEELKELVKKSLLFRLGKLEAVDYYTYLERLGGQVEENLKNYIELVKLQSGIDEVGLFKELDLLQESIYQDLIPDEVARNLYQLDKDIDILDKVMHLKATREDILYYRQNRERFLPENLLSFIKIQVPLNGMSMPNELNSPSFLKEVEQALIPSAEFYKLALERDKVLVDNLMKRMNKAEKDKAVLVCGGFHSEGITDMLKERGINVVTVSPSITKTEEDSQKIYLSRMMDKRIRPEEILSELGLGNLGAPIACDTPLSDLLLGEPEGELRRLCEEHGVKMEGKTIGGLLDSEAPGEGCSIKEILIARYLENSNPSFSSFLETKVFPVMDEKIRKEIDFLKKKKEKLDGFLDERHYWDALRLIREVGENYPHVIWKVFESRFDQISKRISDLDKEIKKCIESRDLGQMRGYFSEIYELDPHAFFSHSRYARRKMEQLDEYISAVSNMDSLKKTKGLEKRICRLIKKGSYVTVFAIISALIKEGLPLSFPPETRIKVLALARMMYQEMNIGALIDKEYSILPALQDGIISNANDVSRYSYEFNKVYEERFKDVPERLKKGRELLGKAGTGLLEKWHSSVLLKDRLKLMRDIAEENAADELEVLKNLLALITVYFKDSYNMNLGVFFGDPQRLSPPTPEHPDFNRLIEETPENYRKVIERLVDFDSIVSSLGRQALNLCRLEVVKKDAMFINPKKKIVQISIEGDIEINFYQFCRTLLHEYGHLFHLVSLPGGLIKIDREKLEGFIKKRKIRIKDESDLNSIVGKIINIVYKKRLKKWQRITRDWIKKSRDKYNEAREKGNYKEIIEALIEFRKVDVDSVFHRFIRDFESTPTDPKIPALDVFYMYELSWQEQMVRYGRFGMTPDFSGIPLRKESMEFFAEYFQLYILHPEKLREVDEEIYELMEILVGNIHLEPALDGFGMDELVVKDEGGDTAITEMVKKLYPQREREGLTEYSARIAGKAALLEETGLGLLWETLRRYRNEDYVKDIFKAGIFAIFGSRLLTTILPIVLLVSGIAPYLVILIMSGWMVINSLVFAVFHENKTWGQAFGRFSAGFLFNLVAGVFVLPIAILSFGVSLPLFVGSPLVLVINVAGIYLAKLTHQWWDKQIRIRGGVGIFTVIGMAVLIILFSILPRKPDVEQLKSGTLPTAAGDIHPARVAPEVKQTESSLRVLYGGRMPIYKDIGKMLQEWEERRLKRKLTDKEQKQVEESAMEYRQRGIYNPSPQDLENICGRIGGLLAPLMKDLAWPGFSEEQMKILLEALLETESDNRQWIIREVDGKPVVYVLGSVKGAYGISQITRIAVQELGKVVYDDLNTISSSDPKSFAYKMAERRLKAIYLLLFANDYSFDAYSKLSIDWVIKHFKTIPNEEGKGRKDFNQLIDASWNLWEYNIRASAAIILTTFDYFIENYGEYKDGNYPIWRWTIAAYNWNKYGMLRACREDKDLCIFQTSELSVDTERYQERQKELSGVSIEDEDFCKLPPLVKELVKGVYKDMADGRFGAARVIVNKIDWSLRKFTKYAEKKKLDLEEVKGFLGITTVRDWNRYMKEGYTLSQILHAEIKKRERDSSAQEGRISRGIESELEARRNLENPYIHITDIDFSRESNVEGLVENAFSEAQGKADEVIGEIGDTEMVPQDLSSILEEANRLFKKTPKVGFNMVAVRSRKVNCKEKEEEDFYCGGYAWSRKRNRCEFQYAEGIMWEARSYDREKGTSLYIEYLFHEALCHVLRERYGEKGHDIARIIQRHIFRNDYDGEGSILGRIIRKNINQEVRKRESVRAKDLVRKNRYYEALQTLYRLGEEYRERREGITKQLKKYVELKKTADEYYGKGNWAKAAEGYYEVIMSGAKYSDMDEMRRRFMECSGNRGRKINAEGKSDKTYTKWVSDLDEARNLKDWRKVASDYAEKRRKGVDSRVLDLMDERLCLQIKRYVISAEESFSNGNYKDALSHLGIAMALIPPASFDPGATTHDRFIESIDFSVLKNFTEADAEAVKLLTGEILDGWYKMGLEKMKKGEFYEARGIFMDIEELTRQGGSEFILHVFPAYQDYVQKMVKHLDAVIGKGLSFSHDKPDICEKANIMHDFGGIVERVGGDYTLSKGDKRRLYNINSIEELKCILSGIKIWTPIWEEIFRILCTQPYPYLIDRQGKRKVSEYEELIRFIKSLAEEHPDFKSALLDLNEAVQNYVNSVDTPTLGGIINDANRGVFSLSAEEKKKVGEGIKTVGDIKRIVEGFVSDSEAWREIFNIVIQKIQEFQGKKSQESAIDIEEVIGIKRIVEGKAISEIVKNRLILNLLALTKNIHILNKFSDDDLEYIIEAIEQFPGELLRILGDPIDLSNASLEEHILGLSYGGRVVIDAGKHRKRDIKDTVWHELIHEASLSYYYDWRYEKKMPTIPADIWEKIAVNSGFIGYLCDNKKRFEFTKADQSHFGRFGKIDRTDWVFWDGERLVDYVPKGDYENIGEVVGGKRYILIPYEDIGEDLKGKGYRFRIIKKGRILKKKKYVAIEVRKDSEGRMSHSKLSPCEFVAYAGAAYIRNSNLEELRVREDSLYKDLYGLFKKSNVFEYLGEYLFTFVDDAGKVVRYEYKEGKQSKVVPVVDPARKKGAKPLANRGPRGYRGQGASMILSGREVMSRFGVKMPGIKVENCKAKKDMYIGCEYIEFALDKVGNVAVALTYHKDSGLYSLSYKVRGKIKIWGELKPGMTIKLGRNDKSDIQLYIQLLNKYVSKEHLEIVVSEERIVVRDLGSHNGTRVIEKEADAHKVPGSKGIYDEDSNADLAYIAEQVMDVEGVTLDVGGLKDLMKISDLRDSVVIHVIESEQLGLPRFRGAKRFHELLPALGSNGRIKGFDEKSGKFIVEKDGKLHIYVTSKYHNKYLSQNTFLLAETIDHEWDENMKGMPHKKAARRARFFVKTPGGLSEYHKFVIGQLAQDGISGLVHLRGILNEKRPVHGEPSVREYEERFRRYVQEKIEGIISGMRIRETKRTDGRLKLIEKISGGLVNSEMIPADSLDLRIAGYMLRVIAMSSRKRADVALSNIKYLITSTDAIDDETIIPVLGVLAKISQMANYNTSYIYNILTAVLDKDLVDKHEIVPFMEKLAGSLIRISSYAGGNAEDTFKKLEEIIEDITQKDELLKFVGLIDITSEEAGENINHITLIIYKLLINRMVTMDGLLENVKEWVPALVEAVDVPWVCEAWTMLVLNYILNHPEKVTLFKWIRNKLKAKLIVKKYFREIEEHLYDSKYLKKHLGIDTVEAVRLLNKFWAHIENIPEGTIFVPAQLIEKGEEVLDTIVGLEEGGVIRRVKDDLFLIPLRNPSTVLYDGVHGRSLVVKIGKIGKKQYVFLKGTGLAESEEHKDKLLTYGKGEGVHTFYGGLTLREVLVVMNYERRLREKWKEAIKQSLPSVALAKRHGVNEDFILNHIGSFIPLALPAVALSSEAEEELEGAALDERLESTLPPGTHLVSPQRVFEITGLDKVKMAVYRGEKSMPLTELVRVLAYITPSAKRNEELGDIEDDVDGWMEFFEYYGFKISYGKRGNIEVRDKHGEYAEYKEAAKKVLFGAAARYGMMIYLLHKKLGITGTTGEDFSIFTQLNTNPISIFDYDTINAKRESMVEHQEYDIKEARDRICEIAEKLNLSPDEALDVFKQIIEGKDDGSGQYSEEALEEVVSEIVGVLDRRGINNISRGKVREIVVEAREAKKEVRIQELLDLAMATGAIKPEEFFDLVYEISMPLKKLFPQEVLEESREVVSNILRGILEAMGDKEAKDDTEEEVRGRFFDKVRKALEQIGMTEEEIESDRELIGKALDMIELYPLIDAEKNPICFDLIKQISQMCGVTETSLVKAFSGSRYGRYEEAGNSRLSRAVGRLRLYKWIRTKGIRGVVNITDLEMQGDFRGTEGVFNGVDFMAIEASNPSDVVRYISGNAVVQEETDYIYEKLKGVVINTDGETFGEVLNGKTPLFISIPEEVFIDIKKSDKKSITYSPGLTAFFRLIEEAKNPNVRVEIRTRNIDNLREIISASRVSDKVTVADEFNNREEVLKRQKSTKKEYGIHSVFVLSKAQAGLGKSLGNEIAGNNIKVFCAENMAPLHAVLLFSALHAAAGEMFSDKEYTDEGKNVIRSLTLFGVSDKRVSEIINNNIPFFIITTEEILHQFSLQRLTIAIAA